MGDGSSLEELFEVCAFDLLTNTAERYFVAALPAPIFILHSEVEGVVYQVFSDHPKAVVDADRTIPRNHLRQRHAEEWVMDMAHDAMGVEWIFIGEQWDLGGKIRLHIPQEPGHMPEGCFSSRCPQGRVDVSHRFQGKKGRSRQACCVLDLSQG